MNDTFTDETQLDIDSSFTDSPPTEEPSTDIVEILPNGDESVITPPVVNIINLRKKWKGICSQVPFIVLKYRQGCI